LAQLCIPFGIAVAWIVERRAHLATRVPQRVQGYWALVLGTWVYLFLWLLSQGRSWPLVGEKLSMLPHVPFEVAKISGFLGILLIVYGITCTLLAARVTPESEGSILSGSDKGAIFLKVSFVLGLGILLTTIILRPAYAAFTVHLGPVDPGASARQVIFGDLSLVLGIGVAWYLARHLTPKQRPTPAFLVLSIAAWVYLAIVLGYWSRLVPILGHLIWNIPGNIFGPSFVVNAFLSPTPKIVALACISYGIIFVLLGTVPVRRDATARVRSNITADTDAREGGARGSP
jgi:hypothetical protein